MPISSRPEAAGSSTRGATAGNKQGGGLANPHSESANSSSSFGALSSGGASASGNLPGSGKGKPTSKMGNGASASSKHYVTIEGETFEIAKIRSIIMGLKQENKNKETVIAQLEKLVETSNKTLAARDEEVAKLRREVDKLKSVLDATVHRDKTSDMSARINGIGPTSTVQDSTRSKKQGVSGESGGAQGAVELRYHEKDSTAKQLIKDAILENDFLKNIDPSQIQEIVHCMYPKSVKGGAYIIREGDSGQHIYVSADGTLEVSKDGKVLGTMNPGRTFGELALLYNCNRTASVKALTDAKYWALDRRVFQTIMMKSNLQRQEEHVRFLKSVPLLKKLPSEKLSKIADSLEKEFYAANHYIVREGEVGQTFFIIKSGQVKITQMIKGHEIPQEIRVLEKGDWFGEKALLSADVRTANAVGMAPGVEVLVLDRSNFRNLIGDLNELKERDYGDEHRGALSVLRKQGSVPSASPTATSIPGDIQTVLQASPTEHLADDITLGDLETIATLGKGGFGRVELVSWKNDRSYAFALKCLKKKHIIETKQQDHIYSEKTIMIEAKSAFICQLYKTFKDKKFVYMLLEACLGGELWSLLRDKGSFDDYTTKFCAGCIVEALEYLHTRGIIYRDLKPENVLLDKNGYLKLCDFGFAKRIGSGRKTWTFCGTPEYVSPEVILNKGHDFATDYWSLGIFMYELLTGSPPFTGNDPMKIYNIILKGIDGVEFPSRKFGKAAQMLIKKLCRDNLAERLGYGKGGISDIKTNKYFQGFDWEGLYVRTLSPPFSPKVKGPADASNFDTYPPETDIAPDELSGWDEDF